MFRVGDFVVYGSNGVCQVQKIGPLESAGMPKDRVYYTLHPQYVKGSTIFTPVDNQKVIIRPVLSREEAMELVNAGINPIAFAGLKLSITSDESKAINFNETPKVIISASGMCEAGRIRHHLKHNLWRPESTILFVGYQSVGTLGRILLEGAEEVKLFGEPIQVRAQIKQMTGLSGHADKEGLLEWINGFTEKPKKVFVVHGEDSVCNSFVECLKIEHGQRACAPYSGTEFNLISNKFEYEAEPVMLKKKARSVSGVYARLIAAGQRLVALIARNDGLANKDMAKFADQINSLCDKWE